MTTERLEELARRADTMHADGLSDEDYADLADLGRCARAWVELQRMIEGQNGYSVDFWLWKEKTRLLTNQYSSKGLTAIEAVEAAEVGK